MLVKILNLVLDTIETGTDLFGQISIDALPENGGLYVEVSPGYNSEEFLNRMNNKIIPLLFLCKHTDQQTAIGALSDICGYIEKLKAYPQISDFEWLNAVVATEPNKIGRDNGYYIYSCIINIEVYF
jgi:hypothetical protein